jgi:farnesyl-diphosphate farnesyltransferase
MDDWEYCKQTLPKVSRTFALNISVLRGKLHRSILTAYLFCRIIDTVEDAAELDAKIKIKLLVDFPKLIQDAKHRAGALDDWIKQCSAVDGSPNDLDLLSQTRRVFNVFDTLPEIHQQQISPSVAKMAMGMAYFQTKFNNAQLTLLENEKELEEYCYYVAGVVGEMLCNLFFQELPHLSPVARETMKRTAVSFGLGLQMTNISKDMVVDRGRGWSYVPRDFIAEQGLTVEEFTAGGKMQSCLKILGRLLHKTTGHLHDALEFTLAIPRTRIGLRLFCIWPLWMAMETVAILHNNPKLLQSDDPVKISRDTVKRILRQTPFICFSDKLLRASFARIIQHEDLKNPPAFNPDALQQRLEKISLDAVRRQALLV